MLINAEQIANTNPALDLNLRLDVLHNVRFSFLVKTGYYIRRVRHQTETLTSLQALYPLGS